MSRKTLLGSGERPSLVVIKPTIPTRLGLSILALIMIIGMMAIVFTNNLFYLVTATLLAFVAMSGILAELALSGLGARRRLPGEVFAGVPAPVTVELTNHKAAAAALGIFVREGLDGPFGTDRALAPRIPPGDGVILSYLLSLPHRGRHRLEGLWVSTVFPFGLWEKASFLSSPREVLVYPHPLLPGPRTARASAESGIAEAVTRGDGDGLVSIRDYTPGDPSRLIHWKSTARSDSLKVKELERTAQRRLTLVLATPLPTTLEHALSTLTGLMVALEEGGVVTTLRTHRETFGPGRGRQHLSRILEHLALYEDLGEGGFRPPPPAGPREPRVVVFEDGHRPDWARPEAGTELMPLSPDTGEKTQ